MNVDQFSWQSRVDVVSKRSKLVYITTLYSFVYNKQKCYLVIVSSFTATCVPSNRKPR